jgi:hypothetical protein
MASEFPAKILLFVEMPNHPTPLFVSFQKGGRFSHRCFPAAGHDGQGVLSRFFIKKDVLGAFILQISMRDLQI